MKLILSKIKSISNLVNDTNILSTLNDPLVNFFKLLNIEIDIDNILTEQNIEDKYIEFRDSIRAFHDIWNDYFYEEKMKRIIYSKHIPGKLTINIVKYLMNIKKNENDFYNSNLNSIEDIFNIIIDKLLSNTSYKFEKQDIVIDYLQTKIIPFYIETYKIIIENIQKCMINYDRFVQNQRGYIHIINNLLDNI